MNPRAKLPAKNGEPHAYTSRTPLQSAGLVRRDVLHSDEPKLNAEDKAATEAFLAKGAGLSTQLDQSILRRLAGLSF